MIFVIIYISYNPKVVKWIDLDKLNDEMYLNNDSVIFFKYTYIFLTRNLIKSSI